VCGAAAASGETQLVGDVDSFPGHIACDGDSKSEIVVPVVVDGKVSLLSASRITAYCAVADGFDETDKFYLEELARVLGAACDW
jgi:putative methionine-R-sulfoxide reductase with GAF domain